MEMNMRGAARIGFPGIPHPLSVLNDVGGPSGVSINGAQFSGQANAWRGGAVVSSSVVQGDVRSSGNVLLTHSLVQGKISASGAITATHSTLHGGTQSQESTLFTSVLCYGRVDARDLALIDSMIIGAAIIQGTANVRGSSLDSLDCQYCRLLQGAKISGILNINASVYPLVLDNSTVHSIILGSLGSDEPNPTIILRGTSFVDGVVTFKGNGSGGLLIVEPGARFTGRIENGKLKE